MVVQKLLIPNKPLLCVPGNQDPFEIVEMFNEYGPAWGVGGDYLFYLSEREFAPQISNIEWNFAGDRSTGIFVLALRGPIHRIWPNAVRSPPQLVRFR